MDENILTLLIKNKPKEYFLHVDNKMHPLENVNVVKSLMPVRKPTVRGGVYFSDTTAYKIKATTNDLSLASMISKVMLGPNTDFKPLEVKTTIVIDGMLKQVTLVTHLVNTMNNKTKMELNLIVDKTELD